MKGLDYVQFKTFVKYLFERKTPLYGLQNDSMSKSVITSLQNIRSGYGRRSHEKAIREARRDMLYQFFKQYEAGGKGITPAQGKIIAAEQNFPCNFNKYSDECRLNFPEFIKCLEFR